MKNGIIVCAFPATGKTTAIWQADKIGIVACDSDSEDHHWIDRTVPRKERPNWIQSYVTHLQRSTGENDFVFASTHDVVREALVANGVPFVVVYPTRDQKEEFLSRVRNRSTGLCGEFGLNLLTKMWDTWLEQMESQVACGRVILQNQQYLADVLEDIKNTKKELFNRV
jgi:hypothetical protein